MGGGEKKGQPEILFWVASRGHHADVGGISPGSMSPNATNIEQEGVLNKDIKLFGGGGIKDTEIAIMTRQLSTMIGSGVPLLQAFDILAQGEKNAKLKKALLGIQETISGGSPLWEAMSRQKSVFSPLYIYLVRAGEMGGALDIILQRLAKYLDDNVRLLRMIKGAMIYPAAVVVVGFGVTFGLLTFVVPQFEQMITSSGGAGSSRCAPANRP